ncbi:DUF2842 domain-containing protein [Sneathiella sp. CAU 1612]|uniref:DUF2842 domain-containing protein n=1 Tax=Sneathiella sedimenti TaxID=2816034 RepID=A0ABS3F375_9PROT|nr:DUF2842 domain-containing protein [Sneathiella sedimenti]MBO0332974.1 DUF2842 domain-containing protein [Sneathiella sedimenti]
MTSSRKLIGLFGLLFLLVIYCAICVYIAVQFLPENKLAELIFYPVVGVIWIFPAAKIIRWMQTPIDPEQEQ